MTRLIVCALCVLAAAAPATAEPDAIDLAGRWQGPDYRMAALSPDCGEGGCKLTLDIARCDAGWCGVEVASDDSCGGTALTLEAAADESGNALLKGKLELARGTEPYVVQAYLMPAAGEGDEMLEIIGDTGGEFRVFRRSFPFSATLARAGEARCRSEKPVS